jgi:hypothetical protein
LLFGNNERVEPVLMQIGKNKMNSFAEIFTPSRQVTASLQALSPAIEAETLQKG